jgi:hypothetical protein
MKHTSRMSYVMMMMSLNWMILVWIFVDLMYPNGMIDQHYDDAHLKKKQYNKKISIRIFFSNNFTSFTIVISPWIITIMTYKRFFYYKYNNTGQRDFNENRFRHLFTIISNPIVIHSIDDRTYRI